jgi:hypothetical protein
MPIFPPPRPAARAIPLALLIFVALLPGLAWACGGCFSPPPPPGVSNARIVQDAERILFVQDPETKTSTVHVEVRFSGAPEDFGWVLPLPAQPEVSVGTRYIFDRLDQAAAPRFEVRSLVGNEGCSTPATASRSVGCGFASSDAAVAGGGGLGGDGMGLPNDQSGVQVLDADQVGPYNYTVLAAKEAGPLQKWLTDNGYEIPESSLPIIDDHLAKGDVFVAIQLARGEGVEAIRPIVLQMQGTEACVPLRLTSIAASDDMNVVVYLAGEGRGVPKNMLHVVPNPTKLDWADGATNYPQVLSAAIDEAEGHAFSTEFARPVSTLSVEPVPAAIGSSVAQTTMFEQPVNPFAAQVNGEYPNLWTYLQLAQGTSGAEAEFLAHDPYSGGELLDPARCDTAAIAAIAAATDGASLQQALWDTRLPIVIDSAQSLDAALPLTEIVGLSSTDINRISVVALWQRFALRFGFYEELSPELASRAVDGATLAAELDERFCAPIREVHEQLGKAGWLTRLALRIDPTEMDRDPIFAFHPDLPEVEHVHQVELNNVCTGGGTFPDAIRFGFPAFGVSYVVPGSAGGGALGSSARLPNDPRFVTAPFAQRIELLDETEPEPMPIAPADIGLVDSAIASAQVGARTLPANLDVQPATEARWELPPSDADVSASASSSSDGCSARFGPRGMDALALLGLLAAAALTLGWRRRSIR